MKILLCFIFLFVSSSCSVNYFDEIAKKDTSEAIFFQAKLALNDRDYDSAVTLFESLPASFITENNYEVLKASAYAGRCGLELLQLLEDIQDAPAAGVLGTLMGSFPGADATSFADCISGQTELLAIGDETVRNNDENLFMVFLSFAKIGTILSALADPDDDGTPIANVQCNGGILTNAEIDEVGSGIANILLSLAAIGGNFAGSSLDDINALCSASLGPPLDQVQTFCNSTGPYTGPQRTALRWLIGSSDYGINSCSGNDFANCALANPVCP